MESAGDLPERSRATAPSHPVIWNALGFALHLAVVYLIAEFCVAWLGGFVLGRLLPFLGTPSRDSSFGFLFSHLLILSSVCGFVGGLVIANYRHRIARYVWIVPVAILTYKFVTFPSTLFENHFVAAFHHYFEGGFQIPEFHSYRDLFRTFNSDTARGLDQLQTAAPAYVAITYGLATWIGMRLKLDIPGLSSLVGKHLSIKRESS
jgi:hypothetical protein